MSSLRRVASVAVLTNVNIQLANRKAQVAEYIKNMIDPNELCNNPKAVTDQINSVAQVISDFFNGVYSFMG